MPADPERVQTLFLKIVELPLEERHEALVRECGSDAELQRRVEALLRAHDNPDSLLKEPAPALQATVLAGSDQDEATENLQSAQTGGAEADDEPAAATIIQPQTGQDQTIAGRYTLEEKIGEGGMGEVWVARQSEPVKRRVALKLIKAGMDSHAVLKRFEQERQALAMMDHPNIAQVLDGGLTPTGQPFFVMELVNGLPLTKFCDETKLTPGERLELFLPICHAVQHAHQKGIVHRDLKPTNILVTMIDGKPVPKVIDFGVAKATSGKLIEETMATQFGAVVGTLEYMSPEQAGFSGTDIDTRADIYSLGVILYELLTGLRPIDAQRLQKAAFTEMIRIIREEDPSKPSTRLSTDASLPSLAAVRQTDPKKLTALLKGELDWVVMKCLEKQRDRRYETANALARDIERHLNDEPVEARPPSAGYRLSKFARRHRAAIVTVCLIAVSVMLGFGVSLWQAIRATRAETLANQRFQSEQQARQAAQTAREGETKQRLIATEAKRLAERREYDASLILVQKNWEQNNLVGFHQLLESMQPADGQTDLRGFEWYYWWNKGHRGFTDLAKHSGQVASVAYSPDGSLLASGAGAPPGKGQVRIWNTATRQIVRELPAHKYRVHKVAFSPDGKYLATACGEHNKGGMAKVWDLTTGEEVFHRDFKNSVNSVAFSPDPEGTKLVAGSTVLIGKWGALKVWNWRTGEELFSQEHENKGFRGATFTPDGEFIAAGSRENGVRGSQIEIWNLATKKAEILPAHADFVFSIAFRAANEAKDLEFRMAAAVGSWSGPPGVVKQWDDTGQELPLQLVGHLGRVWSVCFSHDGTRIATGCFDNAIKIWDAESGDELATLRGHTGSVLSVAFSPDDKHLASGSGDTLVKIWDPDGQQSLTTEQQSKGLRSVTFNRDGTLIASGGDDGNAKIWDAKTGLEIMCLNEAPDPENPIPVYAVAFSPDDKYLATASGTATSFGFGDLPPVPGDIKVWELATQRVVHHFKGHTAKGSGVAFSPDGKRLASASGGWGEPGEIKVWDLEAGRELDLGLDGASGVTWSVVFSPDGTYLAWGRLDFPADAVDRISANKAVEEGRVKSVVVIWDLDRGRAAYELSGDQDGVIDIAFHPGGKQLATAGQDHTIILWDLQRGKPIRTLRGHTNFVHGVAFSPDGSQLASCGPGGAAKLWDLETGREVLTFKEHSNYIWSVAFSPDGEHIASASGDGTIKIWDGTRNQTLNAD